MHEHHHHNMSQTMKFEEEFGDDELMLIEHMQSMERKGSRKVLTALEWYEKDIDEKLVDTKLKDDVYLLCCDIDVMDNAQMESPVTLTTSEQDTPMKLYQSGQDSWAGELSDGFWCMQLSGFDAETAHTSTHVCLNEEGGLVEIYSFRLNGIGWDDSIVKMPCHEGVSSPIDGTNAIYDQLQDQYFVQNRPVDGKKLVKNLGKREELYHFGVETSNHCLPAFLRELSGIDEDSLWCAFPAVELFWECEDCQEISICTKGLLTTKLFEKEHLLKHKELMYYAKQALQLPIEDASKFVYNSSRIAKFEEIAMKVEPMAK